MIFLSGTSEALTLETTLAGAVDYVVSYVDITATTYTPGVASGTITTVATTTIVAAPASGVTRQIKHMAITNSGIHQAVFLRKTTAAGSRLLFCNRFPLRSECCLHYAPARGFELEFPSGFTSQRSPIMRRDGQLYAFYRTSQTAEAASIPTWPLGAGIPAAFAVGTPGLAGSVRDNETTGSFELPDTASGKCRIDEFFVQSSSVQQIVRLIDVLWANSGIVVTTTTAQTINSVAWPARDLNGTTDGEGVMVGLLSTVTNTNAAAIANMTMSYTNSDGVSARTATMPSWPATSVAGSFLPFALQAGDRGVRSIQSITLGTSLGGGAVSLVAYRVLGSQATTDIATQAHTSPPMFGVETQGFELYDTSCLNILLIPPATTQQGVYGEYLVTEI